MTDLVHRLSHTTIGIIQTCPRKYFLGKLCGQEQYEITKDTDFGSAFGIGAQTYITMLARGAYQQEAQEAALTKAILSYGWNEGGYKTFPNLVNGILSFIAEWPTDQWQLWNDATELSFRIALGERSYYCGFIDAVLQDRYTGEIFVLELKTTGLNASNLAPYYGQSPQAIGYAAVLHTLDIPVTLGRLYIVLQTLSARTTKIHLLPFQTSMEQVIDWAIGLHLQYEALKNYEAIDFWPKTGNCMAYNRLCQFYGSCDYYQPPPTVAPKQEIDWSISVSLQSLIDELLIKRRSTE